MVSARWPCAEDLLHRGCGSASLRLVQHNFGFCIPYPVYSRVGKNAEQSQPPSLAADQLRTMTSRRPDTAGLAASTRLRFITERIDARAGPESILVAFLSTSPTMRR